MVQDGTRKRPRSVAQFVKALTTSQEHCLTHILTPDELHHQTREDVAGMRLASDVAVYLQTVPIFQRAAKAAKS